MLSILSLQSNNRLRWPNWPRQPPGSVLNIYLLKSFCHDVRIKQPLQVGGTYRHYKNHLVRVIGIALHSETLEEVVIYEKLEDFGNYKKGSIWARPKAMFLEYVTVKDKKIPRFALVQT